MDHCHTRYLIDIKVGKCPTARKCPLSKSTLCWISVNTIMWTYITHIKSSYRYARSQDQYNMDSLVHTHWKNINVDDGPLHRLRQEINSLYGQEALCFCPLCIKNSADCTFHWHHKEQRCSPEKQWWGEQPAHEVLKIHLCSILEAGCLSLWITACCTLRRSPL